MNESFPATDFVSADRKTALDRPETPRRRRPLIVPLIIVANTVLLVLLLDDGMALWWPTPADGLLLLKWGANYAPVTTDGQWWRIATSMFLHFGCIHFALNMLSLVSIGLATEALVGRIGMLAIYVVSGLVASLVSVCLREDAVSVGASGAIFGVAGALLAIIWRQRRVLNPRVVSSGIVLAFWILVAIVACHFVPMIDNTAHIAGLLAGAVCGLIESTPTGWLSPLRRLGRHAIVLMLGAVVIGGVISQHPGPPTDLQAMKERVNRLLSESDTALRDVDDQFNAKAINIEERHVAIETRVLPSLNEAIEILQSAKRVPVTREQLIADWTQSIVLRRDALVMEIEALRNNDPELLKRADQLFQQAAQLAEELNAE